MNTLLVKDLDKDLVLVQNNSEIQKIMEAIGYDNNIYEFDFIFVKTQKKQIVSVFGGKGIMPFDLKEVTELKAKKKEYQVIKGDYPSAVHILIGTFFVSWFTGFISAFFSLFCLEDLSFKIFIVSMIEIAAGLLLSLVIALIEIFKN